jgi:Uma2 family endonuclease
LSAVSIPVISVSHLRKGGAPRGQPRRAQYLQSVVDRALQWLPWRRSGIARPAREQARSGALAVRAALAPPSHEDDGRMGAVERVQPRVSYADLERAPEDGHRYELYDGEVFVVPAPVPLHQVVQHALTERLRECSRRDGGFAIDAPVDVVFSDYDVVQPDIVYFAPERAHLVDLRSAIRHAPDLCVEILSPSTEATDRGRKLQVFARYGVPEYWIVDPVAEAIEVHRLEASGYVLTQRASGDEEVRSAVVGGAALRAGRIFP